MNFLDVCCLSETKTFEHFSDFLAFTFSSKNTHQSDLNQPTYMFDHSTDFWEQGEEDIEHELGDLEDSRSPKNNETFYGQIQWPRL